MKAPEASMIVGNSEIARRAGVKANTVAIWIIRGRDDGVPFPPHRYEVAGQPGYWWPDVEDWLRRTGRLKEPTP